MGTRVGKSGASCCEGGRYLGGKQEHKVVKRRTAKGSVDSGLEIWMSGHPRLLSNFC